MIKKGSMRPVKKVIGWTLLLAGGGMVLMPDEIVPILCEHKMLFGVVVGVAGYFLAISGRQQ